MCKHCKCRKAEPASYSAFWLCTKCAADLCPFNDVKRYQELVKLYGR